MMMIDRAVVEQALKAMLNFPDDISDEMFASIAALKAALAKQPTPPPEAVTEAEKTAYAAGWWAAMAEPSLNRLEPGLEPRLNLFEPSLNRSEPPDGGDR